MKSLDILTIESANALQEMANNAFKPIQLYLQSYCDDLSKTIKNSIDITLQKFTDSTKIIYENYNQNIAEAFKVIAQTIQLSTQNYDYSNLIDTINTLNLQANDTVELKLKPDEIETINKISPDSMRPYPSSEKSEKQVITFERLISILTLILAILTFINNSLSSNQTNEKEDKIIHLLETISYQLSEQESQEPFE